MDAAQLTVDPNSLHPFGPVYRGLSQQLLMKVKGPKGMGK